MVGTNKNLLVALVATLVIAGGGGFFTGMKYQQNKAYQFPNRFRQNSQGLGGQFGQRADRQGLRPVNGKIISLDEDSVTVELQDGSSKIILLTESSSINKTEEGSKDDLAEGTQILVFGQENADGSITAENIQLNPEFGRVINRGDIEE